MIPIEELTWTCRICGEERPDAAISVNTFDLSENHGLPPGTMKENVRYCNDRAGCIEGAKRPTGGRKGKS